MLRATLPRLIALGFVALTLSTAAPWARASGCHVGDRPQLGGFVALDPYLLSIDLLAGESIDPGNWVPRPCPSETPQPPGVRVVVSQSDLCVPVLDTPKPFITWLDVEPAVRRPSIGDAPLDPPPRDAKFVAVS